MLSIIIPTLNEEEHIESVLGKLVPQLSKEDEVIVVDSHSEDKTVEIAKKHGAKVLTHPRNGNGLAKTEGAKNARNDIVVFIDADTELPSDFVEIIKNHFRDQELLFLGGLTLYSSDSRAWKFIYDSYSKAIFHLGRANHVVTKECYVPPNNSAFRKDVFLKAGGYRSVVCEDADLMRRLPRSKRIKYDSRMVVTLSDRRFKSNGFFRTVALWTWGNLSLIFGSKVGSEKYKEGY
jgi:glycosyltransferase involved in cell wall biosynthesis